MSASASFRAPYWTAFAVTAGVAPIGIVVVALWIDYLLHLMAGAALAVVVLQLILLSAVSGVAACRFEYLTLYRLELDAGWVRGRSTFKSWAFPLSEVEAITPAWLRPWWIADHNRYVLELAGGRHLFIWSGKGLDQFLECVAVVEPRLRLDGDFRKNRAERSHGKSGFDVLVTGSEAVPCEGFSSEQSQSEAPAEQAHEARSRHLRSLRPR